MRKGRIGTGLQREAGRRTWEGGMGKHRYIHTQYQISPCVPSSSVESKDELNS